MSWAVAATDIALADRLLPTSLTLRPGELTCLVGPNGSGKTSLLHALAGIGDASGDVSIDGINPRMLGPDERRRLISFLPASRDILWPLTSRDLVALGLPPGADSRLIEGTLEELELGPMADRRIDRMSTGERSRVLIARALAARPKLLLLDEPVANLDPLWQLKVMEHLVSTCLENDQAALVALHDLDLAQSFADRLIIMNKGRVHADGNPDQMISSPEIEEVFGIRRVNGRWRPAVRPEDRRSLP